MKRTTLPMVTRTDEDEAAAIMRSRNRASKAARRPDIYVLVDGPNDGDYTVMALADAIDAGFLYRWEW